MNETASTSRRIDRLRQIPEERMIGDALAEVEHLGAHPLLTEASQMLVAARDKVADWHDAGRPGASHSDT